MAKSCLRGEHWRAAGMSQLEYETTHRICVELQIRTVAQHAWSEPQHAFYKNRGALRQSSERKLYWAAASAWAFRRVAIHWKRRTAQWGWGEDATQLPFGISEVMTSFALLAFCVCDFIFLNVS